MLQIERAKATRSEREDLRDALARVLYADHPNHRPHSLKKPGSSRTTRGFVDWAWVDAYEQAESMLSTAGEEW